MSRILVPSTQKRSDPHHRSLCIHPNPLPKIFPHPQAKTSPPDHAEFETHISRRIRDPTTQNPRPGRSWRLTVRIPHCTKNRALSCHCAPEPAGRKYRRSSEVGSIAVNQLKCSLKPVTSLPPAADSRRPHTPQRSNNFTVEVKNTDKRPLQSNCAGGLFVSDQCSDSPPISAPSSQ